jgi:hypothetical protein
MNWINTMLSDGNHEISSKRVVTLLAFILCSIAFVVDLLTDYEAKPELFNSMMYIVIAGLGFTASERFAKKE